MTDDITSLLGSQRGKKIMVKLRSGKVVHGVLRDFDIHMSMKLDSVVETPAAPITTTEGQGDDGAKDAGAPERVGDSVLLRGDNILLISILDDADADAAADADARQDPGTD